MSTFTRFDAEAHVTYHPYASKTLGKDYWVLTKAFTYAIGSKDSKDKVYVPEGYLTDGASVPRMLWSLIPPWSSYGQAAILHDYLCEYGIATRWVEDASDSNRLIQLPIRLTRKQVDEIFEEAMLVLNVPKYKVKAIMLGINTYRKLFNPKCPNVDEEKKGIEIIIHNRKRELNSYVF